MLKEWSKKDLFSAGSALANLTALIEFKKGPSNGPSRQDTQNLGLTNNLGLPFCLLKFLLLQLTIGLENLTVEAHGWVGESSIEGLFLTSWLVRSSWLVTL